MSEVFIKNLSISFGKQTIFDGFNLSFSGKGFYAFIAPSGYGKSTLFNIICGFVKPDKGIVKTKGKILYSFQNAKLFNNLTVKENLLILLESDNVSENLIKDTLKSLGIASYLDKKVSKLSSGEYHRVLIAEAILSTADIILLDEPLKYLDQANRELVLKLLKKKSSEALVIASGHEEGDFDDFANEVITLRAKQNGFQNIEENIKENIEETPSTFGNKKLGKIKSKLIQSLSKNFINITYIIVSALLSLTSSGLYKTSLKANEKLNELYQTSEEISQVNVELKINNNPRIITNDFLEEVENVDNLEVFYPNLFPTFNKFSANGFFVDEELVSGILYNDDDFKLPSTDSSLRIGISPKIAQLYFNTSSIKNIENKTINYKLDLSFNNKSNDRNYQVSTNIPFKIHEIVDNEIEFSGLYLSFSDVINFINSTEFYLNEDDENITPLYNYLCDSTNYLTNGNNRISCYNVLLQFSDNESALNYLRAEEMYGIDDVIKTNYYIDSLSTYQLFSFLNEKVFLAILIVSQILLVLGMIIYIYFANKYIFSPLYLLEVRGYDFKELRRIKLIILIVVLVFVPLLSVLIFPTLLNFLLTLLNLALAFLSLFILERNNRKTKIYQKLYE